MFNIREMKNEDKDVVMGLVDDFYHSNAVSHEVSVDILQRTFADAVKPDYMALDGYLLLEGDTPVGYAYVTVYYACEVGGECVMLEEIAFNENARGKGYGTQFFRWLFTKYSDAKRFRLEVTDCNDGAKHLYEKLGFEFIDYNQMILDV